MKLYELHKPMVKEYKQLVMGLSKIIPWELKKADKMPNVFLPEFEIRGAMHIFSAEGPIAGSTGNAFIAQHEDDPNIAYVMLRLPHGSTADNLEREVKRFVNHQHFKQASAIANHVNAKEFNAGWLVELR